MFVFEDSGAKYKRDYAKVCNTLNKYEENREGDAAVALIRKLCKNDLFFLMHFVLGIKEVNRPWIVDRISEVESSWHRTLNLWARGHFKSTCITYGLVIQLLLRNTEERICIFSETRQIAKAFLRRIKTTFEQNGLLKSTFPDIFYDSPERQSPKWSEDEGIVVMRKGQYSESSIEAWGVLELPVGKHYTVKIYDDLVNADTVASSEQMIKLENSFKLSFGLDSEKCQYCVIGTIYHFADLNQKLSESGEWFTRKHKAEDENGVPALLSREKLDEMRRNMGSWAFSSQMLLSPLATDQQEFKVEWVRYYRIRPSEYNIAIFADSASSTAKQADSTVFAVVAEDALKNYYLMDMVRDKLNIVRRWERLKELVKKWSCRTVHYEINGQGAIDVQYFKEKMSEETFYFDIVPIKNWRVDKETRIRNALQPLFEGGRFFLPDTLSYLDDSGTKRELIHEFISDELLRFPFSSHDDMLDTLSQVRHEDSKLTNPYTVLPSMGRKGNSIFDEDRLAGVTFMGM